MIDDDGLGGVTSNPAIFEKAITGSTDYTEALLELQKERAWTPWRCTNAWPSRTSRRSRHPSPGLRPHQEARRLRQPGSVSIPG